MANTPRKLRTWRRDLFSSIRLLCGRRSERKVDFSIDLFKGLCTIWVSGTKPVIACLRMLRYGASMGRATCLGESMADIELPLVNAEVRLGPLPSLLVDSTMQDMETVYPETATATRQRGAQTRPSSVPADQSAHSHSEPHLRLQLFDYPDSVKPVKTHTTTQVRTWRSTDSHSSI